MLHHMFTIFFVLAVFIKSESINYEHIQHGAFDLTVRHRTILALDDKDTLAIVFRALNYSISETQYLCLVRTDTHADWRYPNCEAVYFRDDFARLNTTVFFAISFLVEGTVTYRMVLFDESEVIELLSVTEILVSTAAARSISVPLSAEGPLVIAKPPAENPVLCFGYITTVRIGLFRAVIERVAEHMSQMEPTMQYESIWVHNIFSGLETWRAVEKRYAIEKTVLLRSLKPIAYSMNVIMSICEAPYLVMMEDDWWIRKDISGKFFEMAISVLESDASVLQVIFQNSLSFVYARAPNYSEWRTTRQGVTYRTLCYPKDTVWEADEYGGTFTMGPSVVSVERAKAIGSWDPSTQNDGEFGYPRRSVALGYCMAQLRLLPECTTTQCNHVMQYMDWRYQPPNWYA